MRNAQRVTVFVTDAAIWIGYAWADELRNHAVVMVTGDDKETVYRLTRGGRARP